MHTEQRPLCGSQVEAQPQAQGDGLTDPRAGWKKGDCRVAPFCGSGADVSNLRTVISIVPRTVTPKEQSTLRRKEKKKKQKKKTQTILAELQDLNGSELVLQSAQSLSTLVSGETDHHKVSQPLEEHCSSDLSQRLREQVLKWWMQFLYSRRL